MKTFVLCCGLLAFAGAAFFVGEAESALGDVVSSFPSPLTPTSSSGLAWDGAYLWSCHPPRTYFYCISTTGTIVTSFKIGASYGEYDGATYDGEYLWYVEHQSFRPSYYIQRTKTGSFVNWFILGDYGFAGLASEKGCLWTGVNFRPLGICGVKLTTTGSWVSSFKAPFTLADLAWDGHYLWSCGPGHHMYRITAKGSITASFPVPGLMGSRATTFDGNYLWVENPEVGWFYQIDIGVVAVTPASLGRVKALFR
jgi:hypothetical protein